MAYSQPVMLLAKFHRCQGSGKSPIGEIRRPPGSSSIAAIIAVRIRSQWILTFGPVISGPRIWRISSSAVCGHRGADVESAGQVDDDVPEPDSRPLWWPR
jgi:hypothetical protein